MNFLFKSISNFQFPYTLDQSPVLSTPLWEATNGTKKADSTPVTVFTYCKQKDNAIIDALTSNAVHNAKILKLPGLVRVLDVIDSDPANIYVVTERVHPLDVEGLSIDALSLGVFQISETLNLLHGQAKVILGTLCPGTIFTNKRGEWCLFGLELCSKMADPNHLNQYSASYSELVKGSGLDIEPSAAAQVDSILLARLIKQFYQRVPSEWNTLVSGLSQGRITIPQFCTRVKSTKPFNSTLISIYEELKELQIKDPQGKVVVMSDLQRQILEDASVLKNATKGFVDGLLIPEFAQCISTIISTQKTQPMSTGFASIVPFVATIFELTCTKNPISDDESTFNKYVKPLIFENFKISDRQLRFLLLVYFPSYIPRLTNNDVVERIFPPFVQGLADTDSTIRIQTLKRVPDIISMITERQLNNDLLRHLAKTQMDPNEDIRTWTILVISKLSKKLSQSSNRSGILSTAFTKSLKDPAVKPRLAALYGLEDSLDLFDVQTIANKVLTVIGPGLLDKNAQVRSKARSLFKVYLSKLENEADQIPTDHAEDVEINFQADIADDNDDLAKGFLENLRISPQPLSITPTDGNTTQNIENTADSWNDSVIDEWDAEDDWNNNSEEPSKGNAPLVTKMNSTKSKVVQSISGNKRSNTKTAFGKTLTTKVKVNKSWNDDLNDDEWDDSWAEANDTKTSSKVNAGKMKKSNTESFSSASIKKPSTTNDVFEQLADEIEEDDWGNDW